MTLVYGKTNRRTYAQFLDRKGNSDCRHCDGDFRDHQSRRGTEQGIVQNHYLLVHILYLEKRLMLHGCATLRLLVEFIVLSAS